MVTFFLAFAGAAVGVIVTLGGVNLLTTIISVLESRRQVEQLRLSIDNARKAGIPVNYEVKN
jgi:hypothetical protein